MKKRDTKILFWIWFPNNSSKQCSILEVEEQIWQKKERKVHTTMVLTV